MSLQESLGGRGKRRKLRDGVLNKNLQDARRALYHCNYCQKDISHVPRIKCAECKDFDLCLECFSVGVEIKPHKNTHDYQVVENLSFPIYHPDWGADEEILLLEAIDQYGLGNWGAISEHVGGKTPAQCRQHYFQVYIDVDCMPLPKMTPEMEQVSLAECIARARQGYARPQYRPSGGGDPRVGSEPPLANSPPLDGFLEEGDTGAVADGVAAAAPGEEQAAGGAAAGGSGGSSKGLKRHRHEQHLAEEHAEGSGGGAAAAEAQEGGGAHVQTGGRSMHHDPSQPPAAAAATGAGGRGGGGSAGLDGGAGGGLSVGGKEPSGHGKPTGSGTYDATGFHPKRLEFDPEYDNDAECIVADMEFGEYDNPADVQQKLQMLMIYNRRLDERERRRGFVLERGLLNTRAAQVLEKKRNTQEKDLYARMRVFARYQSQAAHDEMMEGLLLEARLRTRIAELREYRRNGIRTFVDAEVYDTEKRRQKAAADAATAAANAVHGQPFGGPGRGAGSAAAKAARAAAAAGGSMGAPGGYGALGEDGTPAGLGLTPPQSAVAAAAANTAASSSSFELSRPAASVPMGRGAGASLALWRARRGVPLDISCLPGVELLGGRERELCAAVRLLPAHYLALKDMLLRDCEKNGPISKQDARSFFRLDPARSLRIYELLLAAGWIKGGAAGGRGGGAGGSHIRAITAGGEAEVLCHVGEDGAGADAMEVDEQAGDY
ncbi:hypothetical protein Agub_g5858 [Astrephomene gubernaculifera]|uniref:Transcriptional adapter n=1 Tax=Astrephomene gubernaculifera TaxID=47775 RepID=A0AAD3HKZ7_9CHLO|nr:hypothetical protein Agub_g5858 [Astrephomene gubernaculifera]